MKHMRAALRMTAAAVMAPFLVGLVLVQGLIVAPLTNNHTFLPGIFYSVMRKIFGLKVEFNKASAPISKDKPVWFVSNHMALADFVVLGSALKKGTFAGKGDVLKWPVISQMASAVKYIGLRRDPKFNEQSRGKIIRNFNEGHNTIMFPEGTTTDGKKVHLFRAGLVSLLFGDKAVDKEGNEVKLEKEVLVQPVAIVIKEVNGKNAIGNDDLRNLYSLPDVENMLSVAWKQMMVSRTVIEVTTLPALHPKDFKDAKDLINKAALDVAGIVNPGQTTFEKAKIPGHPGNT